MRTRRSTLFARWSQAISAMTSRREAMTAAQLQVTGTPASPGLARGPLHVLDDGVDRRRRVAMDAAGEAAVLRAALDQASRELAGLMAGTGDPDACALLEFQIAMLDDDAIVAPPFAAIANGESAENAWRAALDVHVEDYRSAADAYFAARALDLQDMRDRVLRCMAGAPAAPIPAGAIVVAADLPPSRFLEIAWNGGGIALYAGSPHSHTATLARARGVPMIVAMAPAAALPAGDGLLDADNGLLIAAPDRESVRAFEARLTSAEAARVADAEFLGRPAFTADGERVRVMLNVAHIDDLAAVAAEHCDGIGLVRTELMLQRPADLSDEECQFERYRAIVAWAQGRPVTFRTLDAGGDKPIEGYTLEAERNPFLGVRGVRLSLLHPRILTTQLRALARTAAFGDVAIMIPMVTQPDEMDRVRTLLTAAVSDLAASGTPCGSPALGMMVEVPAAALTIEGFAADFFSIGSNDLIAYTTATSRDSVRLAALSDPLQPAVVRLIREIVAGARAAGRNVSLCGDMASDAACLPALLAAGLRSISVAPAMLARVKATLAAAAGPRGE
jgi:phosphotransferase system enzyme I (PtsI)